MLYAYQLGCTIEPIHHLENYVKVTYYNKSHTMCNCDFVKNILSNETLAATQYKGVFYAKLMEKHHEFLPKTHMIDNDKIHSLAALSKITQLISFPLVIKPAFDFSMTFLKQLTDFSLAYFGFLI